MSDARSAPLYCPYCGDEDLRPNETSHGSWECHSCARVFTVKFVGILPVSSGTKPAKASHEGVSE